MKHFLAFFILSAFFSKAQSPQCTQTIVAGNIYYPNTTSVGTTTNSSRQYLCGPNTIVYDTAASWCWFAYLNPNCTVTVNTGCPAIHTFWLKANSVLNIGPNSYVTYVYYEPGAVINNPFSTPVSTFSCAAISFPTVSCTTDISEISGDESNFVVYPNPSSSQIYIESVNLSSSADVLIFNQLGEAVLRRKDWRFFEKEINIENLASGFYFIQVKTEKGQQTKKFLVDR